MVSQKFMDILYQQPDYTNPSTSSSSSSTDSNEQNSLKKENCMVMPSTSNNFVIDSSVLEPLTVVKVENEDMKKKEIQNMKKKEDIKVEKENEDNYDDLHIFDTENIKKDLNKQRLISKKATKHTNKNLPNPCRTPPSHVKDMEGLRPPSKRVRREKIIFDPSDTSTHMQRNRRRKIPSEVKELSSISEESKEYNDAVTPFKEQGDEGLHCKYCGKYMHRLDYLRLHLMKHTGETPYKCPYCKNAYRARWRLNQHVRTHTRNLPYHCPYCCYRGNRSDYLTSHINRIHKNRQKEGSKMQKEGSKMPSLKKEEIANDDEESKVDAIKEEKLSESELDTIIKEEEDFSQSYLGEECTSNS